MQGIGLSLEQAYIRRNMEMSNKIIDFTELASPVPGEGLEQMTRLIALRKGMNCVWAGRGADGGKDLIITEIQKGPMSSNKITWLVSCKDKAKSGASVSEGDLPATGVIDKLQQHKANGFFLVTTTTVSTAAKSLLDSLEKSNGGNIHTLVWDVAELTAILLEPENALLLQQFLPESYKRIQGLTTLEGAIFSFRDQIPGDLLNDIMHMVKPYAANAPKGADIWRFDAVSASVIDDVLNHLLIEKDVIAAVSATEGIEYDAFVALLKFLSAEYRQECREYLYELVVNHDDSDLVFNAYQFLSDTYELSRHEIIKLSPYVDDENHIIYLREAATHVVQVLLRREGNYEVYISIDDMPEPNLIQDVHVDSIQFYLKHEGRVEFYGLLTMEINVCEAKDMAPIQEISGKFEGYFDISGVFLEEVFLIPGNDY
jgi:hypothetical protein